MKRTSKLGMKPATPGKIRVLIADDHITVLEGLASIISRQADMTVLAQASDGAEVVALWGTHHPDISATVGSLSAKSRAKTYLVPSLGVARPLGGKNSPWQYGFGFYGLAGAGVNYNDTVLSGTLGATPYPLVAGGYTQFETIELAPSLAYRVTQKAQATTQSST